MSKALEGKVAVVTGGSTGIGLGIVKQFVAEGAYAFITARRQQQLDDAVREIGRNVEGVQADVSNVRDLDRLFEIVRERKGKLDILVANAGGGELARLGEISEAHFDKTFDVNVKGMLFTVQKALPFLAPGASIVLTASTMSFKGTEAFSVYSATKAAVRSFARSWILDLKGRDVRVNVLSPGPTKTPGLLGLVPAEHQQDFLESFAAQIPLGRVGDPDELGKAAVFLASDAASFVNGIELCVDGGQAQY
jgi:NAD(P)-dependent dehydrogenase (short-subunit alcohol dehydrogenase family)